MELDELQAETARLSNDAHLGRSVRTASRMSCRSGRPGWTNLPANKLRIKPRAGIEESQRLEWKREALVAAALRFGLVGEQHLRLLPSRVHLTARPPWQG